MYWIMIDFEEHTHKQLTERQSHESISRSRIRILKALNPLSKSLRCESAVEKPNWGAVLKTRQDKGAKTLQ